MEKLIVFLIFVVISLIQAAIKKANENREAQKTLMSPSERPARKNRSQIDEFLTDTTQPVAERPPVRELQNPEPRRLQSADAPNSSRSSDNAAPPEPRQRDPRQRGQRQKSKSGSGASQRRNEDGGGTARRQPQKSGASAAGAPVPTLTSTTGTQGSVGSGIREHVDQYLARRSTPQRSSIEEHVKSDMAGGIRGEIKSQVDSELPSVAEKPSATAESIIHALRNPEGIRQAILVNEILARPRVFRR